MQSNQQIRVGTSPLNFESPPVGGSYVQLGRETYYKISHFDRMPPFFMSIVSASDHWMFISSTGSLTAGRRNPDHALFPYYTDDRIHDGADQTGSKTIILVTRAEATFLWEPFSNAFQGSYRIERNLYKNIYGNKILFEEINHDLELTFRYCWFGSEKYGWVRHVKITNFAGRPVGIKILDGIQNLLPAGVDRRFQLEYSTLVDGYKKNELLPAIGLGIFRLSSIPVDQAEPSESLRATTVWSTGLSHATRLISSQKLASFRRGITPELETDVRARRGAYFLCAQFELPPNEVRDWYLLAEVNQDAADVAALIQMLRTNENLRRQLIDDEVRNTENLVRLVSRADGLQCSADLLTTSRHFMNTLFNSMRGGVFEHNYNISRSDFEKFVRTANHPLAERFQGFLTALPEILPYPDLLRRVQEQSEPALEKLCREYLPLTFSRRHGDPSRPWNIFSIEVKDTAGERILNYEGNWRDIFQNWEALALAFPEFIENMITKFVNASTADGYNPYRVTRDGFDWEVIDPNDPWTYIGYWGDHQIIYLLKLLEISAAYHPERLPALLQRDIFAYANVPYRIKPYPELLQNPHSTINFDGTLNREIENRVAELGSDGKFLLKPTGEIYFVNLTEKLLVPVLAKLTNFIPEAGIWMNTQRPEWNDANNALVGYGVSLVTLYYLRRHLNFCRRLFRQMPSEIPVSQEVAAWFEKILDVFRHYQTQLTGPVDDVMRKQISDKLGSVGSAYREEIYQQGFCGERLPLSSADLVAFCETVLTAIDHTIQASKREDGLFHSYNLIKIVDNRKIEIRHLYEMLEGQVAVLSSGCLGFDEALAVLDVLPKSALYRPDQNSYMLYPNRELPRFGEKNNIPPAEIEKSRLLPQLIEDGNREIVVSDVTGQVHFNAAFRNAALLKEALQALTEPYQSLVEAETALVTKIYEKVFDHQSFTGRSGTFYKYEGLGSVYWHMVSKLALAVSEIYLYAVRTGAAPEIQERLFRHYYKIQEGIGVHKSPDEYGAFPTDPYSHTPGHSGVQQPGLTGQVKEDIISRFHVLGVTVAQGRLQFHPTLLESSEFLKAPTVFEYYDLTGEFQQIDLPQGSLAFTVCQVPVIYYLAEAAKMRIIRQNVVVEEMTTTELSAEVSQSIFRREGKVRRLEVWVKSIEPR